MIVSKIASVFFAIPENSKGVYLLLKHMNVRIILHPPRLVLKQKKRTRKRFLLLPVY